MCFVVEDVLECVQSPTERRARKRRHCDDCSLTIAPGDVYERGVWKDGPDFVVGVRCARCIRIAKVIYDREIAEGCEPYESRAPYGGNAIEEYCVQRNLGFDDAVGELVDGTRLDRWIEWMDLVLLCEADEVDDV